MYLSSKYCPRCEKHYPREGFGTNPCKSDGLQGYCRGCMKLYRIEHYRANKKPYMARAKANKASERRFIINYKIGKGCMDCGITYPHYVMQFDHRDAAEKLFTIGRLQAGSTKRLLAEIKKCDLVCANCHFEREHQRRLSVKGNTSISKIEISGSSPLAGASAA